VGVNLELPHDEFLPVAFEITFRVPGAFTARVKQDHCVGVLLLVGSVENNYSILALFFPVSGRLKGRDIESFRGLRERANSDGQETDQHWKELFHWFHVGRVRVI